MEPMIFCDFEDQKGKLFPGPCFWWLRDASVALMQWLHVPQPL